MRTLGLLLIDLGTWIMLADHKARQAAKASRAALRRQAQLSGS